MGATHAEALSRIGVSVSGVLGSSSEKSERAAKAMGLEVAYGDLESVLSDASVDAVHLCVPNHLHFDYAKRALEAGKHVMCEKPLGMTAAETGALVDLAQKTGLAAGVCYNLRFYPLVQQARALREAGQLGRIFHINGCYVQDWLLDAHDYNWRLNADQGGALRAVSDIGTHWMDMVTSVTGLEIEAVFAELKTVHEHRYRPKGEVQTYAREAAAEAEPIKIDTEDYGCILFRFSGGVSGSLHVSQVAAGRKNSLRFEVSGEKTAIAWDSERPNELWQGHRDKANEILLKDPSLMAEGAATWASYPGGHAEGYPDTFKQCFKAFYQFIENGCTGTPEFPTFADGHKEALLCDAILESSRAEKWISVKG